jgi:PAS domain S-box-containing protein
MSTPDSLKVLLIEDDINHAKIIMRHLRDSNDEFIEICHANSLDKGLNIFSKEAFHAVLLDLRLPDSGIDETLDRTLKVSGRTPIIVLSSMEDRDLARKMIHEGAQDYICKVDLSRELLIRTIYNAIERKKTEENLKATEAKNSKIIEASLDCIISIDENGLITEFNPAAERTFGYSRNEVMGLEMALIIVPENLRAAHRNGLKQFLRTGYGPALGKRLEMTAMRRNGSEFPVEVSIVALPLNDRQIFTGFIRDITEQKRASDEIKIAKEAAEVANRAKSSFLANMSHEIRTPLGIVLGYTDLLATTDLNTIDKNNFIAAIKRNGELLSKIINDILDLSKVEAGKLELLHQEVSMTEILADTESLLKLQANEKGISLQVSMDDQVPPTINTDLMRLRQILVNIIGNAIKFTDKGIVAVNISTTPSLEANRSTLVITVKDSGRGISPPQAQRLFTPFTQADVSTTRKFGGTGLGLVLAKRLAQLLGGDVELSESELGKGSIFKVTIDAGLNQSHQIKSAFTKTDAIGDKLSQRIDGMRILLTEDSKDNQLIVSRLLTTAGAKVDIVENGKEAIDRLEVSQYDLVLMDIQMPIMDGYEATTLLRSRGFKTPILALTAHALEEERQHCLNSGFSEHISKPIERKSLIEKISQFQGVSHDINL